VRNKSARKKTVYGLIIVDSNPRALTVNGEKKGLIQKTPNKQPSMVEKGKPALKEKGCGETVARTKQTSDTL